MGACACDKLLSIHVPHILEKIFFNLDYVSFLRCLRVNKAWSELISSDLYLKKGKSMFCEDIFVDQKRLFHFSYKGNPQDIKNCLQSLFLDVNLKCVNLPDNNLSFINTPTTCITAAAYSGHTEVVKILLDHGANDEKEGQWGTVPLHFAASRGRAEVSKLLLARGTNPNITSRNGWTPLHFACKDRIYRRNRFVATPGVSFRHSLEECLEVIQVLLDAGADPTIRDNDGKNPLDLVPAKKHRQIMAKVMAERGWQL